jgi:uncharacterized membrane protein
MNKLHLIVSGLMIAGALAASTLVYQNREAWLPEKVPVHWGIDFQPDAWADRQDIFWHLFAIPLVMVGVAALVLALITWFSPRGFEPTKANPSLTSYLVLLIIGLMTSLHIVILLSYVSEKMPVEAGIMGVIFAFFILMGNILGKVQRNFWVGIRTPWTLANHVVWEKTHRLAAWLFVIAGFAGLLSLLVIKLLPMPVLIGIWVGMLAIAALVPVIYSLMLYKKLERSGKLDEPMAA